MERTTSPALNASYEPLCRVCAAIVLLLKDKAEVLEAADNVVRSANLSVQVPLVITGILRTRTGAHECTLCAALCSCAITTPASTWCSASQMNLTIDHVPSRVRRRDDLKT